MNNVVPGVTRFRCFFEQSGTFKNEFIKLGFDAFDYDLLNEFGETDYQFDLFEEITCAFRGEGSIFDQFTEDDFIIAFFPCIRFSKMSNFEICGYANQCKSMDLGERMQYSARYERSRSLMFSRLCNLVTICFRRGLRLIIENPYSKDSYLVRYFPMLPGFIDTNRRDRGDWFVKPTMYYFINCSPSENFIFESIAHYPKKKVDGLSQTEKSLISPDYANRFIREFVL